MLAHVRTPGLQPTFNSYQFLGQKEKIFCLQISVFKTESLYDFLLIGAFQSFPFRVYKYSPMGSTPLFSPRCNGCNDANQTVVLWQCNWLNQHLMVHACRRLPYHVHSKTNDMCILTIVFYVASSTFKVWNLYIPRGQVDQITAKLLATTWF